MRSGTLVRLEPPLLARRGAGIPVFFVPFATLCKTRFPFFFAVQEFVLVQNVCQNPDQTGADRSNPEQSGPEVELRIALPTEGGRKVTEGNRRYWKVKNSC